jgi:hypothetical protein
MEKEYLDELSWEACENSSSIARGTTPRFSLVPSCMHFPRKGKMECIYCLQFSYMTRAGPNWPLYMSFLSQFGQKQGCRRCARQVQIWALALLHGRLHLHHEHSRNELYFKNMSRGNWKGNEARWTLSWFLVKHPINTEIFLDTHCSNCDLFLINSNWGFDLEVAGWDWWPDPAEHPDTSWILAKLSSLDSQEIIAILFCWQHKLLSSIRDSTFQVYQLVQRLSPSPVEMSLPWSHSQNLLWNKIEP